MYHTIDSPQSYLKLLWFRSISKLPGMLPFNEQLMDISTNSETVARQYLIIYIGWNTTFISWIHPHLLFLLYVHDLDNIELLILLHSPTNNILTRLWCCILGILSINYWHKKTFFIYNHMFFVVIIAEDLLLNYVNQCSVVYW